MDADRRVILIGIVVQNHVRLPGARVAIEPLNLPMDAGADRTHYQLVLLARRPPGRAPGRDPATGAIVAGPWFDFATFEDGNDYLVLVYYAESGWEGATPLGDNVVHWLDWAAEGTPKVTWSPRPVRRRGRRGPCARADGDRRRAPYTGRRHHAGPPPRPRHAPARPTAPAAPVAGQRGLGRRARGALRLRQERPRRPVGG